MTRAKYGSGPNRSTREIMQDLRDREQSIDHELQEAYANVNHERKERCRKNLVDFINCYLVGSLFETPPEGHYIKALEEMQRALLQSRPYNIELPRGSGKTSAAEACVLWLISYGLRKYCVIVSNNQRQANAIVQDFARIVTEGGTAYAQDWPEIVIPYTKCNGGYRRRVLQGGHTTDIQVTSQQIVLPRITDKDGREIATSQSVICARGKGSGLRGLKHGSLRPDVAILDDLQDSEEAQSPEQVSKTMDIVNKDIINLSSNRRLVVLMTSTPICPEDLCERIERSAQWKTTKYKAFISFPDDFTKNGEDGHWGRYWHIYDRECMADADHIKSRAYYETHREEMDKGAEVFCTRHNPSDGTVSAVQALMDKYHLIGHEAFASEMQMEPVRQSNALDIDPRDILAKVSRLPQCTVPPGATLVCATADLNVSYAITLVVTAFAPDQSATVLAHRLMRTSISTVLNDTEYSQAVYQALSDAGRWLKSLNLPITAWGIDAGGRNWETVCRFARCSTSICGIPACAMAGRASHVITLNPRNRLRDALNSTVLCGDAKERTQSGTGYKYMFFDADLYKVKFQKSAKSEIGAPGGLSIYKGTAEHHLDFATQTTNERLKAIRQSHNGRDEYVWTSKDPHDYLDCMAMAYAIAGSQGISGQSQPKMQPPTARHRPTSAKRPVRKQIRFV